MMKQTHWSILICLSLVLATLLVYWPVFGHDFINFDDEAYVARNEVVRAGVTLDGVSWAFSEFHASNWHPLTWLSHMLDVELYGLDAGRHHATSLIIHILNALLLFLLMIRMTRMLWCGAFVAAAFAIHPMHVESVAWIAERKDVLKIRVRQRRNHLYSLTLSLR